MLALLFSRRFGPLFVTQFLGAFNDNLFKTALIFLVTYQSGATAAEAAGTATMAAGLFILPFFLFSGPAGQACDGRDKAGIARLVKTMEIGFMALGWLALQLGSLPLGLGVVFLMGCHSTLFGPVKYAILPQHLAADELLAGTGLVEGATFVAILLGQVAGGLLPVALVGPAALAVAGLGWLAARFIPPAPPEVPGTISWNIIASSRDALRVVTGSRALFIATLAVSWFWALGAVYTSQFVPLAHNAMGGNEAVATLFLASFSVGIALGSVLAGKWLGAGNVRWCAPAGLVMALAGVDLLWSVPAVGAAPKDVALFLSQPASWRVLADMLALALAGGVFSVPLYGVLQTAVAAGSRARAIAANNIINAGFQVGGVLAAGLVLDAGVSMVWVLAGSGLTVLLVLPALARLRG
ncbi:MAG: hypothetical protein WCO82_02130 [Sphingomonadales bacterium]